VLWACLAAAGLRVRIEGRGALFQH
jgi:hypothetical protein